MVMPQTGPFELPLKGHSVCECEGKLICFGGQAVSAQLGARHPPTDAVQSTPQPTAQLWIRHPSASGKWVLESPEGAMPEPRSGHVAVGLRNCALVLGGTRADHGHFDDVWKLELSKTEMVKRSKIELRLDAWPIERAQAARRAAREAEARAAAEAAAESKPAAKGKGGKAPPAPKKDAKKDAQPSTEAPKASFQLEQFRSCLSVALGIPPGALDVEVGDAGEVASDLDGITVWLTVRPMRGVGLTTLKADGDALPEAALSKLEELLIEAKPVSDAGVAAAPPAKDAAKGRKDSTVTIDESMKLEGMQRRLVNHRILGWKKYTEVTSAVKPIVRWSKVDVLTAAEADTSKTAEVASKSKGGNAAKGKGGGPEVAVGPERPSARTGHSATLMASGKLLVYGGMTSNGVVGDVWQLDVGNEYVWRPVTPAGNQLSSGRTYHGAMARPAPPLAGIDAVPPPTGDGREQLIIYGGSDGKSAALGSIAVLTFPEIVWSSPRVSGPAPSPRGWVATVGMGAEGNEWRGIIFGGVKGNGVSVHDAFTLRALGPIEAPSTSIADPKSGAKAAKKPPPKGKNGDPSLQLEPTSPSKEPEPSFAWFALPDVPATSLGRKGEARVMSSSDGGAILLAGAAEVAPVGRTYTIARILALEEGRDPDAEEHEEMPGEPEATVNTELPDSGAGTGMDSTNASLGEELLDTAHASAHKDSYNGPFDDGQPHGHGICKYADGSVYEGGWVRGLRHGHGTLTLPNMVYVGGFESGHPAGEGTWSYQDGSKYTGELMGGVREGKGTLWMADASEVTRGDIIGTATYIGGWARDSFEGHGTLRSDDGLVSYEGDFKDGLRHGSGVMRSRRCRGEPPEVYDGQWQRGHRHGRGRCTYPDGSMYEGEWMSNQRNGWGEMTESDGALYSGKWVGGVRCGEGKWVAGGPAGVEIKKEMYQGQWQRNARHGRGRCEWPSGAVYEGDWRDGQRHGVGRLIHPDGGYFDGQWSRDQRHGYGTEVSASGDEYRGQWVGDVRQGEGELTSASGARYVGSWFADTQHGRGELTNNLGDKYVGDFNRGVCHGEGTCVYRSGAIYEGSWMNGHREGKGKCTYPAAIAPQFTTPSLASTLRDESNQDPKLDEAVYACYEGEWMADEREGLGRYIGAPEPHGRGETYDGLWKKGLPHGHGKCVYPDGDAYEGEWVEGKRHGGGSLTHPPVAFKLGEVAPVSTLSEQSRERPVTAPEFHALPKAPVGAATRPTTVQGVR